MNSRASAAVATTEPQPQPQPQPQPSIEPDSSLGGVVSSNKYKPQQFDLLQAILFSGYAVLFVLCVALIVYMRYHRNMAFRGDATAARKLILPSFEPFVWILAVVTGMLMATVITISELNIFPTGFPPVLGEFFYAGRQFVFISVIVLMQQRSITHRALRDSVIISFGLATYTVPIRWYMTYHADPTHSTMVMTVTRSLLLIFYTNTMIFPPLRANKVTLRQYCLFVYGYFALLITNNELFANGHKVAGFVFTTLNVVWGSLCPLVIWRVLRADTEHWRGFGVRAEALQTLFCQRNNLMDEYVSSQGLHVLIEMHSSHMIDFAYLEIRRRIGVGATAVVFTGLLKSKIPVAIKVYTPSHFDEDTVAEFSHEAALCGTLRHPNIVTFHGMCISPPTICLVYELCLGSLEDVMMANVQEEQRQRRQTRLIQLGYMLDAARAVAYLHSFSPPFLHRDLKPANFVVDVNGTAKLTDFGESRSMPREVTVRRLSSDNGLQHSNPADDKHGDYSPPSEGQQGTHDWADRSMTVCGTVDYMAPEVINGRAGRAEYGAAADVYSLAITFWDILHPGEKKYPMIQNNHMKIFEHVLDGERPTIASHVHPALRELLALAWQHEPEERPTLQTIVKVLENIQEETHAVLANALRAKVSAAPGFIGECKVMAPIERSFTGTQLTALMTHNGIVASTVEAIRMGNALMDAGLLHHLHHARAFTNSDAVYYFDDENILLNQPIALKHSRSERGSRHLHILSPMGDEGNDERGEDFALIVTPNARSQRRTRGSSSDYESFYSNSASNQSVMPPPGPCECRKLGQQLALAKKSSRRRFHRHHNADDMTSTLSHTLKTSLLAGEEETSVIADEFLDFDQVALDIANE